MTTQLSWKAEAGSQFSLTPRDLTKFIGTLLDQAEITGKPEKAVNLFKQLAGISGETFASSLQEAFKNFLRKNEVSRKNVGAVVSFVMKEMLEVSAALSEVVVEVLTRWVAAAHTSRLSLHSAEGQTALQLLQTPEICRELKTSAALGYSDLNQELRKGLIYPSTSLNSDVREVMLEMMLLMNMNIVAMEDPVKNVLPRLLTYSMVSSLGECEEEEDIESDQIDALERFSGVLYEEIVSNASGGDKHQDSEASVQVE